MQIECTYDLHHVLTSIRWDERGLVPVVVQDEATKEVLMVAYMDRQALQLTISTGLAHYFSRSRKKIWLKGEQSGHIQKVKSIRLDCDSDAILIVVEQHVAACHTGYFSCFFRALSEGRWEVQGLKVFEEEKVYGRKDEAL
ncbi:MAG: phosphoribosyl-AMP cyclohydrolase [Candidatus Bathyarchaeia archaeon]